MKLPAISMQPVGEFALGNIARPDYMQVANAKMSVLKATGTAIATIAATNEVADVDEATGTAAKELSDLRGKLEYSNTLDADQVPEGLMEGITPLYITDAEGNRSEVDKPKVYTHEVAEEMWSTGSDEIIQHHAGQIKNPEARAKFVAEMTERYVGPGTLGIARASAVRLKAYGQANATQTIEGIAASNAPSEVREEQMREVIARQIILGADPKWGADRLAEIGPMIDQMDIHNAILSAGSADEIDLIEEDMWAGGSRMGPEQMRTMSSQMDARRRDFKAEDQKRQDENADNMFLDYHDPNVPVTTMDVAEAVDTQQITREAGWTFTNGLEKGGTTKASQPWTLSRYRGEIQRLQYVGNNLRIDDKGRLLKLIITRASMGLTPQGAPTVTGEATISGTDAQILNKEIDAAVKAATENQDYKTALSSLLVWTRSSLNLEGQIVSRFGGNQNQIDAAVQFKTALDNYMDAYGIDADPTEFVNKNKDAYDPRNFTNGINARFLEQVPSAAPYMTADKREQIFTRENQESFKMWLSSQVTTMGAARVAEINQLFNQFYKGEGIPPEGGALMLEPDDPLYRQFQMGIPDNE